MSTIENLSLPNFLEPNILEELKLSADAAAGQPIISVNNPQGAIAADYLAVNPGGENSELRKVNTGGISGNNITFDSNLSLQHRDHERVVKLFGNKIKAYRAPNVDGTPPTDDKFDELGSTAIDVDQPFSYYTDPAGGADWWYKFTYLNETTGEETDISLAEPVRGGGYGHYVSLGDVRAEAGLTDAKSISETQVAQRRDEAESEIKGVLSSAGYTMPLQTANGVPYTPPLIRGIARLLAAGFILSQNFGTTKPSSSKDGKNKQDSARATLKQIGNNEVTLLDSNDQMLAKPALVDGYPNDSTPRSEKPKATMSKVF